MPEKSTTPRANIPEKTTPMATSSRRPERRAMSPTVSALATAAIEPPIARFTLNKNAMTTPGNAACEIASPRNARPRRTTNTPTEAHTIPTRTLPTSARCTNVNASGAKRSGMVLVAVQLRPAGAVAAVRLAEDPVVAEHGRRAVGDDPADEDDVLDEERVVPAQRFRLGEIRDAAGLLASARAQDPDAAAHRRQQPGDDLQQGRLSGAVRSDEREQLAGAYGEVHVAQDWDAVVPGADVLQLDRPEGVDHV